MNPPDYTDFRAHQAIGEGWNAALGQSGVLRQGKGSRFLSGFLAACLLVVGGCGGRSEPPTGQDPLSLARVADTLGSSVEHASNAASTVSEAVAPHALALGNLTADELAKLSRWEYRVSDIAEGISAHEVEAHLNRLGAEGWECSVPAHSTERIRVYCKRRPVGVLQYLKQFAPLM